MRSFDSLPDIVAAVNATGSLAEAVEALATEIEMRHHPWRAGFVEIRVDGTVRLAAVWAPGDSMFTPGWEVPGDLTADSRRLIEEVTAGRPVSFRVHEVDLGLLSIAFRREGIRSFVSFPVMDREKMRAFVMLGSVEEDGFTEDDLPLFAGIGRGTEAHLLDLLDAEIGAAQGD